MNTEQEYVERSDALTGRMVKVPKRLDRRQCIITVLMTTIFAVCVLVGSWALATGWGG